MSHIAVRRQRSNSSLYMTAIVAVSICAVLSAFAVSIYTSEIVPKAQGFIVVLITYLVACALIYGRYKRTALPDIAVERKNIDVETQLAILEEAGQFFASSLSTANVFRLVTSRLARLVQYDGVSLLLLNDDRDEFVVGQTSGVIALDKGAKVALESGIIGQSFNERDVIVDRVANVAAVPLKRNAEVFGVLVFDLGKSDHPPVVDTSLLDAIGERTAPLFLSSIAYERSQRNALTDHTTDLPNERAFYLVLENQVAETVRKGSTRPLTLLSFDIRGFENINSRFGHAAGDRLLNLIATSVKESLRQMDFFARGRNDEFLAVMPTASVDTAEAVIARIQTSLSGRRIKVSDVDAVEIELNFGWASFGSDGETSAALLAVARERREQARTGVPGSVLWFPQDIAH